MDETMRPLPSEGPIKEGTLVWGAEFNAAVTWLYRWWSLLDVPAGTAIEHLGDGLFAETFAIRTPEMVASDREGLDKTLHALRATPDRAHHLDYDDYRLRWINGADFRLHAAFEAQIGTLTERRSLTAVLRKLQSGLF